MPKKVFEELEKEKQDRILDAAIKEFAEYGYENGSTNRIVSVCGISKGSLFKYFENKEELYFYLIDTISVQMAEEMKADISKLSADLYERVIEYSAAEITWYAENPVKGKFMIRMAAETDPEIRKKILERYGDQSGNMYLALLKGTDMSGMHNGEKEITDVLGWVLRGFNSSFLKEIDGKSDDIGRIRKRYVKKLKTYLNVLKNGL